MYFRFRGNNIQIVKSKMDPATGKARSIPVGSINRANLAVSDKLAANCSAQELKEIKAWVNRYRGVDDLKRKVAALTLPEQVAAAIQWFEHADPGEAADAAEDALTALGMLRQVLVRRGLV